MRKLYIRPVTGIWTNLIGVDVWEILHREAISLGGRDLRRRAYDRMLIDFSLDLTPFP